VINADENTLQGWLDLQRMWFDNRNDPTLLKAQRLADALSAKPGRQNAADGAGEHAKL
jgi:outer membrane PBP1 activator LpoA protein